MTLGVRCASGLTGSEASIRGNMVADGTKDDTLPMPVGLSSAKVRFWKVAIREKNSQVTEF